MSLRLAMLLLVLGLTPKGIAEESRPLDLSKDELYRHVVGPILNRHCAECHNEEKRKGGLSLRSPREIRAGGDSGDVLSVGDANESLLYQRVMLSVSDDDVMPPSQKPRLSDRDIRLLRWWLDSGTDMQIPLRQIEIPNDILPLLEGAIVVSREKLDAVGEDIEQRGQWESHLQDVDRDLWSLADRFCFDCHGDGDSDDLKGGFSVAATLGRGYSLEADDRWDAMVKAVETSYMPPKGKITPEERVSLVSAMERRLRQGLPEVDWPLPKARRLTRLELNNALRDVLGFKIDLIPLSERLSISEGYFQPGSTALADVLEIRSSDNFGKSKSVFQRLGLQAEKIGESGFDNDQSILTVTQEQVGSYLALMNAIVRDERSQARSVRLRRLLAHDDHFDFSYLLFLTCFVLLCLLRKKVGMLSDRELYLGVALVLTWIGDVVFTPIDLNNDLAICAIVLLLSGSVTVETERRKGRAIRSYLVAASCFMQVMALIYLERLRGIDFACFAWVLLLISRCVLCREPRLKSFVYSVLLLLPCLAFFCFSYVMYRDGGFMLSELRIAFGLDRTEMIQSWSLFFGLVTVSGMIAVALAISRRWFPLRPGLVYSLFCLSSLSALLLMPASRFNFHQDSKLSLTPTWLQDREAYSRISRFTQIAFKAAVTPELNMKYMGVYRAAILDGEGFREGIAQAIVSILISPRFLFRYDSLNPPGRESKSDFGLAHRLSFLLWRSVPDVQLLEAARLGVLSNLDVLSQQFDRMLADARIKEFSEDFSIQWMRLAGLDSAQPDPEDYSQFYSVDKLGTLAMPMKIESILLFEKILIEGRSLLEFVNSDSTYVNARLARLYGVTENVPEALRKRQEWKSDQLWKRIETSGMNRGGLASMAGPLTLTSFSRRTSPVKRGIWFLDVLKNRPPPEPRVAASFSRGEFIEGERMRDRLTRHRADPACASCHDIIDPIGFAFEEFDPIGRFRTEEGGHPIDSSGHLLSGDFFNGSGEFRLLMLAEKRSYVRGFVEKLMAYALGRVLCAFDRPAVSRIVDYVEQNGDSMKSAIFGVIMSPQFQGLPLWQDYDE